MTLIPEPKCAERIDDLTFKRKPVCDIPDEDENPLWGAYVMETGHTELEAEQIWKLYMTPTQVESAFRSLKTDLGTRPIFHQLAERTEAHLFVSVLAYAERQISVAPTRCWSTRSLSRRLTVSAAFRTADRETSFGERT